jgi:hypothetical protein
VPAADVYVLSHIIHDWDDESCRRILGSIAKAAKPGNRLVVVESVMPDGDEPHPMRTVDLIMLSLAGGRERTEREFRALLDSAGFTVDRIVRNSLAYSFIEATVTNPTP